MHHRGTTTTPPEPILSTTSRPPRPVVVTAKVPLLFHHAPNIPLVRCGGGLSSWRRHHTRGTPTSSRNTGGAPVIVVARRRRGTNKNLLRTCYPEGELFPELSLLPRPPPVVRRLFHDHDQPLTDEELVAQQMTAARTLRPLLLTRA